MYKWDAFPIASFDFSGLVWAMICPVPQPISLLHDGDDRSSNTYKDESPHP